MGKKVVRDEIVDYVTYAEIRDAFRAEVMAAKATRRVHIGEYLTLLFENHLTVRYQIQEMLRVERIVKEADIRHEIETYNELLGAPGELGCTLMIEVEDPTLRQQKLSQWLDLPERLYLELEDSTRIRPTIDERQCGDDRLSAVQYLKFNTEGKVPVVAGVDHPDLSATFRLNVEQRRALANDLE